MTDFTLTLSRINEASKDLVGGKAVATAEMSSNGLKVPKSLCVTTHAYDTFLNHAGLREKILMEYYRKRFEDMRWEEIWDIALRIKNMFLRTSFPPEIHSHLSHSVKKYFKDHPVVVRSSSIAEDSAEYSFAGIHESYVNITGVESILKHIKLVWASLFSDAAILYRQETGLDVSSSKMAVLVQQFIKGHKSGVAFGKSPNSDSNMMIEAVYGLNQGLVDGNVEPDRWVLSRRNGRIISCTPAKKTKIMTARKNGITISDIPDSLTHKPVLTEKEVYGVYNLCNKVEDFFGSAQDSEWTYRNRTLYALQSRPITAQSSDSSDGQRSWYLSLKRSLKNLKQLRKKIEHDLIPEMQEIAASMEKTELSLLSDNELASELDKRKKILKEWRDIYWDEFIPLAHGVRLFGEVYNKQLKPEDPYEFTRLLVSTNMKSLERNRMLQKMAKIYVSREMTANTQSRKDIDVKFDQMLNEFLGKFSNPVWGLDAGIEYRKSIMMLLRQMAKSTDNMKNSPKNYKKLEARFIDSFSSQERNDALELLDLARVSYQLRDDDNIYLGKIEGQLYSAVVESKRRLGQRFHFNKKNFNVEEAILALNNPGYKPVFKNQDQFKTTEVQVRPRQLTGQPAGQGIAIGKARVIKNLQDLFKFQAGEILVCDSIDPNMTFIVPMAAGIIERRGGMLIHGAIIAREYGLPCITGVTDAAEIIKNGQKITVDGYLGIVTIVQGKP